MERGVEVGGQDKQPQRITQLATADVAPAGVGARLVSAYAGPRHLARLLRHVADRLEGAGIANLPVPAGAAEPAWRRWLRHRALSKPNLWPNHREAVATGFLDPGTSAVLVLPTGAGKTALSELKIAATLSAGRKVIFLVPTLALPAVPGAPVISPTALSCSFQNRRFPSRWTGRRPARLSPCWQ